MQTNSNNYAKMKNKKARLSIISEILHHDVIGSQDELLQILKEKGYEVTQATLSRDLKGLKVSKTPLSNGMYKYSLPSQIIPISDELAANNFTPRGAVLGLEFSGNLAVIKTKPGYASAIGCDLDNRINDEIIGTIAGDDTVLLIPRDGVKRESIIKLINLILKS